ncbi:MAG: hypothetical protein AB1898_01700 [Acidobacteriota bacterium]
MFSRFAPWSLLVLLWTGLYPQTAEVLNEVEVALEDYDVYSAAIDQLFLDEPVRLMVIENRTAENNFQAGWTPAEEVSYVSQHLPSMSPLTLEDYQTANRDPKRLKDVFHLEARRILIDRQEVDEIFRGKTNGWDAFYRKYPEAAGYLTLSRVGFSLGRNEALVHIGYYCNSLCGRGTYFLLIKKGKTWKVAKEYVIWSL